MPVSSSVRRQVARLLPGRRIDYVIPAVIPGASPAGLIGTVVAALLRQPTIGNVVLAVTDTSITVLSTGFFGRYRPKTVVAEFPRATRLGPIEPYGIASITLGGVVYEVDDEYHAVIHAVDAETTGAAGLPQDPLPDL